MRGEKSKGKGAEEGRGVKGRGLGGERSEGEGFRRKEE